MPGDLDAAAAKEEARIQHHHSTDKQLAKALIEIDLLRERVLELEAEKAELEWKVRTNEYEHPIL